MQDGVLLSQSAAGSSHPVQLPVYTERFRLYRPYTLEFRNLMGVPRLLAPRLTSLVWLGVVSSTCLMLIFDGTLNTLFAVSTTCRKLHYAVTYHVTSYSIVDSYSTWTRELFQTLSERWWYNTPNAMEIGRSEYSMLIEDVTENQSFSQQKT